MLQMQAHNQDGTIQLCHTACVCFISVGPDLSLCLLYDCAESLQWRDFTRFPWQR